MRFRIAVALLASATLSSAYYHYTHYQSKSAPWIAAVEKFDLAALPNKTVSYFIQDPGAVQLAPSDSRAGLISQIRAGATAWNDVAASQLRIAFGGIVPAGSRFERPVIEVLFDEMPPGVIAMGGPQTVAGYNGAFIPITRAQVILNKDLSNRPSYSEAFFGTLVHEFGHALGLQHTLTSSVMSTSFTRSTTKARPLAADDVAGLAALYPAPAFVASTGTISGRLTMGDAGVHLASVVAITPNGPAVSAVTDPDGHYTITGLTPGQYFVYAHPLPPPLEYVNEVAPANIWYPVDPDGNAIKEAPLFETRFYPGVRQPVDASPLGVGAGRVIENVNFSVPRRASVPLHSIQTYGYPAQVPVKPPHLNINSTRPFLIAGGVGLMPLGRPVDGLSVSVLGGHSLAASNYAGTNVWTQLDVDTKSFFFAAEGPRHLLFTTPQDIYVLPAAWYLTQANPPSIDTVEEGEIDGVRHAYIRGANLGWSTRVLFDGVPGRIVSIEESGRLVVLPPRALPGHRANLVALNRDGQSSLFLSAEPKTWQYAGEPAEGPAPVATPESVPAGVDAALYITLPEARFGDPNAITVGFGTPDVTVRGLWRIAEDRLAVSVAVAENAVPGKYGLTVVNGLEVLRRAEALEIAAPTDARFAISSAVVHIETEVREVHPGAAAAITVTSLPAGLETAPLTVVLNEAELPAERLEDGRIRFTVPADAPLGPATLRLKAGDAASIQILFQIDAEPPRVREVHVNGEVYKPEAGMRRGAAIALRVTALAGAGEAVDPETVLIVFGGREIHPSEVHAVEGAHEVRFNVPDNVVTGDTAIVIRVPGRTSPAAPVRIAD